MPERRGAEPFVDIFMELLTYVGLAALALCLPAVAVGVGVTTGDWTGAITIGCCLVCLALVALAALIVQRRRVR